MGIKGGLRKYTKEEKEAFGIKERNGMVIGTKREKVTPQEAIKAGLVKVAKKPFTPKHVAGARVELDENGKRVAADPEMIKCSKCNGCGAESWNLFTGAKTCKNCKGLGWLPER